MDAGALFDALVDVGPGLQDLPAYLGPERREQVAALAAPSPDPRPDGPSGLRAAVEGGAALAWPGDGAYLTGFSDPYLAADVARAANDWTIARCEAGGGFLYGSILVATHLPHDAAREIERCAEHGLMRQVLLCSNAVGRTFGHSVYAPIHEAAAAAGLPIAIRAGAAGGVNPPLAAGGAVGLPLEQPDTRGRGAHDPPARIRQQRRVRAASRSEARPRRRRRRLADRAALAARHELQGRQARDAVAAARCRASTCSSMSG